MKELSREAMEILGIKVSGSLMDNGEYRFRLMAGEQFSSTGYIMTKMPDDIVGAWQIESLAQAAYGNVYCSGRLDWVCEPFRL